MTIKKRINLSTIVLFLSAVAMSVFLFGFIFNGIKKDSENFSSRREQIFVLEKRIENLENFKKTSEETEFDLRKIDNLFIDPVVPVDFITFMEKTADNLSLSHKISPNLSAKTDQNKWTSLVFELNLTGSFSNLMKFLEKMENSPYLIKIQKLKINNLSGGSVKTKIDKDISSGDINAILSIEVFTYK